MKTKLSMNMRGADNDEWAIGHSCLDIRHSICQPQAYMETRFRLTPVPATRPIGRPGGEAYFSRMNKDNGIGPESNGKTPAGNLNVVLVEDSILMRAHIAASLSAISGVAALRQAEDVPSGLRLLETIKPDVLILDIELPGQTGLDLLKIVRRRDAAVVIIMLSNHDHPMLRQQCANLGANFYFNKSSEFERVAEVCRELAERRARQAVSSPPTAQE